MARTMSGKCSPQMMMRLFVLLLLCSGLRAWSQPRTDSLLQALHQAIETKDVQVAAKLKKIESLKLSLSRPEGAPLREQFQYYDKLYHQYKKFIYDSAFNYATKLIHTAYRLNDKSLIGYANVKLGFILISSGMFKESFDSLIHVDVNQLHDSTRAEYYALMARAYYDLATYNNDRHYEALYDQRAHDYMDLARRFAQPGSYDAEYLAGLKNLKMRRFQESIDDLEGILKNHKLSHEQLAVNYHNLSYAYQSIGETDKAVQYMAKASLADIAAATKETAAMYTLAKLLYEMGDIENAYVFIKQAMDDAEYYGARQRKVEIGPMLPVIASSALSMVERQRKAWIGYGVAITALSLLVLIFLFIIFKQLKRLKAAEAEISKVNDHLRQSNQQLREANKIKEEYIGYYFTVNSAYLDKIESFKQAVDLKLNAKKYDDIRFIVNTVHPKRDREELYHNFDKVFVKLFPDFVERFNSYFKPEDRIVLKDGQLLNTELRIFALIRMGITDTEEIARILNYSVNTIYAYKTRIRNKSILPNEEFETRMMEIPSA